MVNSQYVVVLDEKMDMVEPYPAEIGSQVVEEWQAVARPVAIVHDLNLPAWQVLHKEPHLYCRGG